MGTCSLSGWTDLAASMIKTPDPPVPSLGSCGALIDIPPGSLVVPKACVAINRNWDYDFVNGDSSQQPYFITKQVGTLINVRRLNADVRRFHKGGGRSRNLRSGDSCDGHPLRFFLNSSIVGVQITQSCPARAKYHKDRQRYRERICRQVR